MLKAFLILIKGMLVLYILAGLNALIRHPNIKGLIYGGGSITLGISGIYAINDRFGGGIKKEEEE